MIKVETFFVAGTPFQNGIISLKNLKNYILLVFRKFTPSERMINPKESK